jgi:hypothetical protein
MNLCGFTADQYARFDLKNNTINDYISEIERWETRGINRRYNIIFDDKLLFYELFHKYINIPTNYAWIDKGHIFDFQGDVYSDESFLNLLKVKKRLILKPVIAGGSGKGVSLLSYDGYTYEKDFNNISEFELTDFVRGCDDFLVSEFVNQHEYSKKIFDKSVNTIRVITVYENNKSTLIDAVHRFGVNECIPVDNESSPK